MQLLYCTTDTDPEEREKTFLPYLDLVTHQYIGVRFDCYNWKIVRKLIDSYPDRSRFGGSSIKSKISTKFNRNSKPAYQILPRNHHIAMATWAYRNRQIQSTITHPNNNTQQKSGEREIGRI